MTREEALAQFQAAYGGRFDSDAANDFENIWRQSTDAKAGQAEGYGLQNSSPFASLFSAYAPRIEERFMPTSGRVVDSQSPVAANLYGDNPINRATSGENPNIYAPASAVPRGFAPYAINAPQQLKSLYSGGGVNGGINAGGFYGPLNGPTAPNYSMSGQYQSNMGLRGSAQGPNGQQVQNAMGPTQYSGGMQQQRRRSPYQINTGSNQSVRTRMNNQTGLGLT